MDIYAIFSPPLRLALRIYFKKIYIINEVNVPAGKKALYLLNHPTSFVDPILLATQTKAFLHFLIRGDVFKKGLALKLLNGIHGIPIFRATEVRNAKEKNEETFDRIGAVLHKKESVMIMPEGSTDKTRRLRPFKKGFAHMAFHYWKKYQDPNLLLVPVSLSYSDPTHYRSVVHVYFEEPIHLKDYIDSFEESPVHAVNKLRDDAYSIMRKNIVHIDTDDDLEVVDDLIQMTHHDFAFSLLPVKEDNNELLQEEIKVTESINQMQDETKVQFKDRVKKYKEALTQLGISDASVATNKSWNPIFHLMLILVSPIALLGYVFNVLPLLVGKKLAYKLMKRDEFICSVKIGASFVLYLFYLPLIFGLSLLFIPLNWALAGLISIPLSGLFFIYFRGAWIRTMHRFNRIRSKSSIKELEEQRQWILDQVQ